MKPPQKDSISRRMILSFCILIFVFLLFGLYTLYGIHTISGFTHRIYNHPLFVSNAALQSNVSITKMHRSMKDVVLFNTPGKIQTSVATVDHQEQLVYHYLNIVRDRIIGDEGRQLEIESRILFDGWAPIRQEVIALVSNGKRDQAAEITIGKGASYVVELEKKMSALTEYARAKASSFMNDAEKTQSQLSIISVVFLLLATSISSLIALFTIKQTTSKEHELREFKQLLMNSIDYAAIGMVLTKPGGEFYRVNETFCETTGYSEEELLEMSFQEITYPGDYDIGPKIVKQLSEGKIKKASFEKRYVRKDGKIIFVYLTTSLLKDSKGSPLYLFSQVQDISDRKKSEASLKESELRLREAQHLARLGNWFWDVNSGEVHWSDEVYKIFGLDPKAFTPCIDSILDLSPWPEDHQRGKELIRKATQSHETGTYEQRFLRPDGSIGYYHSTFQGSYDEGGKLATINGVIQDITERTRDRQRIEHLNRILRSIRDVNQMIVHEKDPEKLIQEGCRIMVDNRGYVFAMIVLTDENDLPLSWAGSGIKNSFESLNAKLNRHELPPCCSASRFEKEIVLIDDRNAVCGNCPVIHECPETHSLCVRLIHEDAALGYLVVALDQALIVDDEDQSLFAEMAKDLAYALSFLRMKTSHEVSESKREALERQLIQAQKMESVGRLAGGVAHDYNNMLSVIIGNTELAMEKIEPEAPLFADLQQVLAAAKRSAEITKQLLAFARRQTIAPKVLDLNLIVEGLLNMLRRLIGEDIQISWQPGEKVWPVEIDPSQINQILVNLCVNARDAIADVGKIAIETKNVHFAEDYCTDHAGFIPGDYVVLAVSDDGSGMAPETLEKVFEPFFTTKGLGKGTGLGLSTVYGIVKQNNGFVNIYSERDEGTTIKVYLLRHTGQAVEIHNESTIEIPQGRGETVLLVEDDDSILKLGQRLLENLGYNVLPAGTQSEAKRLAAEHAGQIDLLLTDVVMPEMNGRELSEHLQLLRPGLKILYMSGYTANVIAHRGVLDEGVFFIPKPLSKKELAVKVRQILDGDRGCFLNQSPT